MGVGDRAEDQFFWPGGPVLSIYFKFEIRRYSTIVPETGLRGVFVFILTSESVIRQRPATGNLCLRLGFAGFLCSF